MRWNEFLRVAYPEPIAVEEAGRSSVYKANRWVGLRFAYAFYRMGVAANVLSVTRLVIAFAGFYLVALAAAGHIWEPLVGVLLLAWQINLDFADGALARANGKTSVLGQQLDGLANAASRAVMVLLLGFLAGDTVFFLASGFSAYVLIMFLPGSGLRIKALGKWRFLALVFRIMLFVPVMVVLLPLVIALHSVLEISIEVTARVVTLGYAVLAVLWILLCLWSAGARNPPLESVSERQ